jgi:hypothetical protein
VDVAQAVGLDDIDLLVLALAEMRVDDDGAVVAGMHQGRVEAVLLHRLDDAVELPGGRRAARVEEVPGDVDLEGGVDILGEDVLIPREVHHGVVIPQHGCGGRPEDRDFRFRHLDFVSSFQLLSRSRLPAVARSASAGYQFQCSNCDGP